MDYGVQSEGIALKNTPHIIKTWSDDGPSQCFDSLKSKEKEILKYKVQREEKNVEDGKKKSTESLPLKTRVGIAILQ